MFQKIFNGAGYYGMECGSGGTMKMKGRQGTRLENVKVLPDI